VHYPRRAASTHRISATAPEPLYLTSSGTGGTADYHTRVDAWREGCCRWSGLGSELGRGGSWPSAGYGLALS